MYDTRCGQFRKEGKRIDVTKICQNAELNNKNVNFHPFLERELADLLKKAKTTARKKSFKFVWVGGTTVMARKSENTKIIKINSIDDLKKMT